jgi:hypothetical protein
VPDSEKRPKIDLRGESSHLTLEDTKSNTAFRLHVQYGIIKIGSDL